MTSNFIYDTIAAFDTCDRVCSIALLVVLSVQIYFYVRYMAAMLRYRRIRTKSTSQLENTSERSYPGVSVIVCARNEADNIEHYLQALLTQDYPLFEVIVVNDGSEDSTQNIIDRYVLTDQRVRTTFVPLEARVGSTKKLGLTLAAKAAKYDYLLLTDADCRPESKSWITEMMKGFRSSLTGVVLGYGAYFYQPGAVNRLVRYDTLFNGLHYMGAALCGHPYMGVGRNLAYRKSLFFAQGGFQRHMSQRAGDDDLLINQIANKHNTEVVFSPQSITWSIAKQTFADWCQQKRRHLSVSPSYRGETQLRLLIEPLTRGIFYAMLIALAFSAQPVLWIFAAAVWLIRWLIQIIILNASAKALGEKGFCLSILGLDILLPLISLYILITNAMRKPSRW